MDWHSRPGSLCQARGTRSAASALLAANHTVSPVFSPQPLTPGCAWKSTSPSCLIFMSLLADALRTAALCFSRHPSCHGASGQLCARRWLSRPVRKCMNILCICGLLFGVGLELTPNFFFFDTWRLLLLSLLFYITLTLADSVYKLLKVFLKASIFIWNVYKDLSDHVIKLGVTVPCGLAWNWNGVT